MENSAVDSTTNAVSKTVRDILDFIGRIQTACVIG